MIHLKMLFHKFLEKMPLICLIVKLKYRFDLGRRHAERADELFPNEAAFLEGSHRNGSGKQSAFFFTLHRSGSIISGLILKRLVEHAGMTAINLGNYLWMRGKRLKKIIRTEERGDVIFRKDGYLFGPFRRYIRGIAHYDEYKIIVQLRDPRDVLVSWYFSRLYSHPLPKLNPRQTKFILSGALKALIRGIDGYVLSEAKRFAGEYKRYFTHFRNRPNVMFITYEEMVTDFESWLNKIITFLELDVKKEFLRELIEADYFKPEEENVFLHKRQMMPGDYKRKLKSKTIERLNEKFGDVLKFMNYEHV